MTETNNVNDQKVVKKEKKLLPIFTNGIIKENQILIMMLGLCPVLGTTTSLEGGFGMGVLTMLVLVMSNVTISLIRKVVPDQVRIPSYILIIATEVTVIGLLTEAFAYELFRTLGTFIPLITVNCIIFGRAEAFASKNSVGHAALDGLGVGIGVILVLSIMGLFRELLGTGNITIGALLPLGLDNPLVARIIPEDYIIPFFTSSSGAFIVLAIMLAITTVVTQTRGAKK
ncbi:electron transport complex subunit RsxE [Acholeplasma sp. OttesenSCG-928-E16]|nr:electron transport complex subunit RsxE [Acholeplasma sp. OttesenSCG-928-E16]